MINSNLTQSVLQRVADNQIKPKSRLYFIVKRSLIWLGVLLSIIIGSLASSVLVFLIVNNDWEAYDLITHNLMYFILLTLPYFWLFIFIAFVVLAYSYMRRTQHGYRYSLWSLTLIYLVLCFIIGGTAYAYGGSQEIDRLLTINVPLYKTVVNQQTARWSQPQQGLIAGDIEKIDANKKEIILEDIEGHLWHVDYSEAKLNNKIKLDKLGKEKRLQLVGIKDDENNFTAKEILPAKPTLHKKTIKK